MAPWVAYLVFFLSGISGLIYQLAWVRQFGHAFGNTIHSTSLVVAIFMLGLGVGGHLAGVWADGQYQSGRALLKAYAAAEGLLAILALAVTLTVPLSGGLVARLSSYTTSVEGWNVLTTGSYLARAAIAFALLTPITLLMGATLTLLIRYLVRADVLAGGGKIARLYAANTAGAAMGALLTDVLLIPLLGLRGSQLVAVALNLLAGAVVWFLVNRHIGLNAPETAARSDDRASTPAGAALAIGDRGVMWSVGIALGLSGFAVMGMEILWLRHATLLLGGFRAVFSMTMTVLLLAMGAGALFGGWVHRRWDRPGDVLVVGQALFVVLALLGLASADITPLQARAEAVMATLASLAPWRRTLTELGYTARPLVLEVGLPSFVAGFAFPLANAVVQRLESEVGRRAGTLYLANTVGAVAGSLAAGYLLLPQLGLQAAAFSLACVAAVAIVPLLRVSRRSSAAAASLVAVTALTSWTTLPADYLLQRTRVRELPGERIVAASEGLTEVVTVVEVPGRGRALITNGHAMSSTAALDQRYMRAMAHVPLLAMTRPSRVLVIGFGVGNTTHAATLHSSVRQVDVVDLSRHVLEQAHHFRDANHDVLRNAKVSVYVNDGRQHLRTNPPGSYDLITLEPPPIAYAGVAALYSREFYDLARSRLTAGRLHQPMAAGLPGAGRQQPRDGARLRGCVPAGSPAVGHTGRAAARRHLRPAHRDRSAEVSSRPCRGSRRCETTSSVWTWVRRGKSSARSSGPRPRWSGATRGVLAASTTGRSRNTRSCRDSGPATGCRRRSTGPKTPPRGVRAVSTAAKAPVASRVWTCTWACCRRPTWGRQPRRCPPRASGGGCSGARIWERWCPTRPKRTTCSAWTTSEAGAWKRRRASSKRPCARIHGRLAYGRVWPTSAPTRGRFSWNRAGSRRRRSSFKKPSSLYRPGRRPQRSRCRARVVGADRRSPAALPTGGDAVTEPRRSPS